jgi:hypothetical protein
MSHERQTIGKGERTFLAVQEPLSRRHKPGLPVEPTGPARQAVIDPSLDAPVACEIVEPQHRDLH